MKKIFLFFVLIVSFASAFAQVGNDTTKYTYYSTQYGQKFNRVWGIRVVNVPNDTTYSKNGLAIKSSALYYGDGLQWRQSSGGVGLTNPMTSVGDMIVGGASGTPTRLGIGSSGQIIRTLAGSPQWFTPASGDIITWLGYTPGNIGGVATQIPYISAANTLSGDNLFVYDVPNHAVRIGANAAGTNKAMYLKYYGASNGSFYIADTLPSALTGNANIFWGANSGRNCTSCGFNTVIGGALSGKSITTGTFNALFGYDAGENITDGGDNFIMGGGAAGLVHGLHNISIKGSIATDLSNAISISGPATANGMAVFADSTQGVALGGGGAHTANKPAAFKSRIYFDLDSNAYFFYNGSAEVKFGGSGGGGGGTGNPNTHAGAGYWIDNGANNILKTFGNSYALNWDSLTSNVLTPRIDTTKIHSSLYNDARYLVPDTLHFYNGLTVNTAGDSIRLGGTLTQSTTIDGTNTYRFTFDNFQSGSGRGFRVNFGSDATGDIFYRDANANWTRLGIGSSTQVLTVSGGLPSWQPAAGGLTSSNFVVRETPSGTLNGSNVTFTLANTPTSGTEQVFLNGQLLTLTTDYSISSATITMVIAPVSTDKLRVTYMK